MAKKDGAYSPKKVSSMFYLVVAVIVSCGPWAFVVENDENRMAAFCRDECSAGRACD